MERRKSIKDLVGELYEMIPFDGRYERDIMHKLVNEYPQATIEATLLHLCREHQIRKCGDKMRLMYVREPHRVRYLNITPLSSRTADLLVTLHKNFEEKT